MRLGWLKGASAGGERHQATRGDVSLGVLMGLVLWVVVALAVMHSPPLDVGENATLGRGGAGGTAGMGGGGAGTNAGGDGGGEGGRVGRGADGGGRERAAEGGHGLTNETGGKSIRSILYFLG